MAVHTQNYTLGKGKIYFDLFDANGNPQGERYIGNTPGFTVTVATETLKHYSSEGGVNVLDASTPLQTDITGNITVDDISDDNLALFFQSGAVGSVSQVATPVADEAITVQQGRYYQLGVSASNPTGVRNVSSVVIQDDTDTTTYVLDTDYELDAAMGRIYIIPGGGISDDDVLHVDYTPAAETRSRIAAGSEPVRGALRYIANNPKGANKDAYGAQVVLSPNGDLAFKTENAWMQMQFGLEFEQRDTSTAQLYIDGRAVA